jgi:hypothetical protein
MAENFGWIYAAMHIIIFTSTNELSSFNTPFEIPTSSIISQENDIPIANEDAYTLALGCENFIVEGNVLENDNFNGNDEIRVAFATAPPIGRLSIGPKGNFIFKLETAFEGEVQFFYQIYSTQNVQAHSNAIVTITIGADCDCDNVINTIDLDDDNDGIIDIHEGEEDADLDGVPNCLDIDSDNDGITDLVEWQSEFSHIVPLRSDLNNDGWDDAFDGQTGGEYYDQADTDLDGIPDFLDDDSDNDGVSDRIEALDIDNDGIATFGCDTTDTDNDGLLDFYDTSFDPKIMCNSVASNCPLPDFNGNSIRDWRDETNHPEPGTGNELEGKPLLVYPNPVQNKCWISVPQNFDDIEILIIQLYNTSGKLIFQKEVFENEFSFNTSTLQSGIYLLQIKSNTQVFSRKIVKAN